MFVVNFCLGGAVLYCTALLLGMHGEIFHVEIFKNFVEILKYFKTPSLKYFMKFLIFITVT